MSVTVDPETDTPDRLRTYARTFSIDLNRWVFLRGTMSQTYELLYSGFHLPMSSDPQSPPQSRVMHSTRFVLIDKNGVIRGYFDGLGDLDKAAIAREARRLLEVGS
jgi:protein SCO1/2